MSQSYIIMTISVAILTGKSNLFPLGKRNCQRPKAAQVFLVALKGHPSTWAAFGAKSCFFLTEKGQKGHCLGRGSGITQCGDTTTNMTIAANYQEFRDTNYGLYIRQTVAPHYSQMDTYSPIGFGAKNFYHQKIQFLQTLMN